jgi:hypothetical protein
MQLQQFIEIADVCAFDAHEWRAFARLTSLYLDARHRGALGVKQEDVEEGDTEYLIQLFNYDAATGLYTHPALEDHLIKTVPASKPTTEEQFEAFWRLYPRKVAKAAARKAWLRLVKDTKLADYVVLALRKQINAQEWLSKDVQFIPHATTWINQQRWEDEVVPANQPASAAPVFAGVR